MADLSLVRRSRAALSLSRTRWLELTTPPLPPTPPQPDPPLQLSGTPASVATLAWQVAAKEGVLEKVQDELRQVRAWRVVSLRVI